MIVTGAVMSECGQYRYRMTRAWIGDHKICCFVMLNPSTADATEDDPTIRRCIRFAAREGCSVLQVVNLFAWRSTDPKALAKVEDPIGPENIQYIIDTSRSADVTIAAWGAGGKRWPDHVRQVNGLLGDARCLGKTKEGHPRHPLYVRSDHPLEELAPVHRCDGSRCRGCESCRPRGRR